MRVTRALPPFLLHRLSARSFARTFARLSDRCAAGRPLIAGLACAALAASALTGCASSRSELGEKPFAAEELNNRAMPASGAQTTTVTRLQKFFWIFSPYRPVIQQGNFISEEMLAQLKVGMTRDQVRFVLGTPLMADMFHAERWDYPFRLARGNGEVTTSSVVVYFKDDKVERYEGGNLPTEKEYIARIAGPATQAKKDAKQEAKIEATQPVAPGQANPLPGASNEPAVVPTPIPLTPAAPASAPTAPDATK